MPDKENEVCLGSADLIHGVVAGVDQQLNIVVDGAADRLAQEAGDNAGAVVIGLGVVHGRRSVPFIRASTISTTFAASVRVSLNTDMACLPSMRFFMMAMSQS